VKGTISDIQSDSPGTTTVNLETGELFKISCQMAPGEEIASEAAAIHKTVELKGICSGMLMDVVLVNCVVSN